jgi:predicted translin family RNA/ssDNA-binding protein
MKTNRTTKGEEVLKLMRKIDKYSKSSIELVAYTQILKQQKQLNGKNHHISININTEC